jgi:hypothetical protein
MKKEMRMENISSKIPNKIVNNKLGLLDIKQALSSDIKFRELFPELKTEIDKFLKDPGCGCNNKLYQTIMNKRDRLQKYFPKKIIETTQEQAVKLAQNTWTVINCDINELESRLKKLPPGRKMISMSRYQDQVTVVVNEISAIF